MNGGSKLFGKLKAWIVCWPLGRRVVYANTPGGAAAAFRREYSYHGELSVSPAGGAS